MSKSRRTEISLHKLVKGPGGRNLCRCGCGRECQPPRQTFFGDECVHKWKIRSDSQYVRLQLLKRDKGICRSCGLDCVALEKKAKAFRGFRYQLPNEPEAYRKLLAEHPGLSVWSTYWQADHIVEVADGGGECDLANFATMCLKCHKIKSAANQARRARERRLAKATIVISGSGVKSSRASGASSSRNK